MRSSNGRRGGIIGALLLIVGLVVCAGLLAVIIVVKTVRVQTRHRDSGDTVSIDTPAGHLSLRAHENIDPEAVGVPIYPGAHRTGNGGRGGGAMFEWSSADGKSDKSLSVVGADLLTDDSPSDVLDFYRGKLSNWIVVTEKHGETRLEHTEGGLKRIVVIKRKSDGTHIGVASVGEPAGN